jgi:hypothetical protein
MFNSALLMVKIIATDPFRRSISFAAGARTRPGHLPPLCPWGHSSYRRKPTRVGRLALLEVRIAAMS